MSEVMEGLGELHDVIVLGDTQVPFWLYFQEPSTRLSKPLPASPSRQGDTITIKQVSYMGCGQTSETRLFSQYLPCVHSSSAAEICERSLAILRSHEIIKKALRAKIRRVLYQNIMVEGSIHYFPGCRCGVFYIQRHRHGTMSFFANKKIPLERDPMPSSSKSPSC